MSAGNSGDSILNHETMGRSPVQQTHIIWLVFMFIFSNGQLFVNSKSCSMKYAHRCIATILTLQLCLKGSVPSSCYVEWSGLSLTKSEPSTSSDILTMILGQNLIKRKAFWQLTLRRHCAVSPTLSQKPPMSTFVLRLFVIQELEQRQSIDTMCSRLKSFWSSSFSRISARTNTLFYQITKCNNCMNVIMCNSKHPRGNTHEHARSWSSGWALKRKAHLLQCHESH